MARRRQPKTSQAERRYQLSLRRTQILGSVLNTAVRMGGFVWIAYYFYRIVAVLAGQTTTADIGIKLLGNLTISQAVAWLFGAGGTAYGLAQRKLRKQNNEATATRVSELEQQIDLGRSSSKLTRTGQTHPRDAL